MTGPGAGEGRGEYLIVARVRRPHGVKGEVLVSLETDRPRQVFRAGRPLQLADGEGNPTGRAVGLAAIRPTTGGAILRLEGVTSREQAEGLRGHTLLIPADEAQPAAPDEVHYRHLVGLEAIADGQPVGTVEDVLQVARSELLLVRGSHGKEILIPFVKELVAGVDLEARELRLKLPEGFLEI